MLVPFCALVFLVWTSWVRIQRAQYVTSLAQEAPILDGASPANLGGSPAQLIVPQHDNAAYEWLALTRHMLAQGDARVRRIDYENAPFGRPVYKSSPYRWWLGALAWCDRAISGRGLGLSLEQAALISDPLLHLFLFILTVSFVAWEFGGLSAALVSAGLVLLFPFATEFLAAAPSDRGLLETTALWSILTLVVGIRRLDIEQIAAATVNLPKQRAGRLSRPIVWFAASGVLAGLGIWLDAAPQFPLIFGTAVGAALAAFLRRRVASKESVVPVWIPLWRAWGLAGAITVLVCYLLEFAPGHLGAWELRAVHPLDGVAWLGLAELVAQVCHGIAQGKRPGWKSLVLAALGLGAFVALPIAIGRVHGAEFLGLELSAVRLTRLYSGAAASHVAEWIHRDGVSSLVLATFLPLLLLLPALWLVTRRHADLTTRTTLALVLGPAIVLLGYSFRWLSAWATFDAVMLAILAVGLTEERGKKPSVPLTAIWFGLGFLALIPSATRVAPNAETSGTTAVVESDVQGLIERDLARWIATHAGSEGGVVLAPPSTTTTAYYFGGLRGLSTLDWENRDGLSVAVRIVSASTPEEAKELIDRRGVTHIVIPSWDAYLDIYARIGMGQLEGTFLSWLHAWKLPNWLRPVAYPLPMIPGFEPGTITVFQVVEEQDDATAASRIAEYFLEMNQLDRAKTAAQTLRRYPADMGAWVTRAEIEMATNDETGLSGSMKVLLPMLKNGADRSLNWDQRVALTVVLARAKQTDLARAQVKRCVEEVTESDLRMLPTGALYRLQVLSKAYATPIADVRLREIARALLPSELRGRL